jgi:hypothetical protein
MALAAWILMGFSVLVAFSMIAAGIEMNRRSYGERRTPASVTELKRNPGTAVEDGRPHELDERRAA